MGERNSGLILLFTLCGFVYIIATEPWMLEAILFAAVTQHLVIFWFARVTERDYRRENPDKFPPETKTEDNQFNDEDEEDPE